MSKVAIVGAGIIGVCIAFFLKKNGYQVTLFDNSTGWEFSDSGKQSISGGTLDMDVVRDGSGDQAAYDLTSVSDTKWKLRFSLKFTSNVSQGGNVGAGNGLYVGLSSGDKDKKSDQNHDFIGCQVYRDNQDTVGGMDTDGSTIPRIWDGESEFNVTIGNTTTTYYFEVRRTSATAYTVKMWTHVSF